MRVDPRGITLAIRDDGVGFVPAQVRRETSEGGFGLTGMRERARLLGGQLRIASRLGHGTTVRTLLPLPAELLQ